MMSLPVDQFRHMVTDARREQTLATLTDMFEHVATCRDAPTVLNVFDYLDRLFPPQKPEGAYTLKHLLSDLDMNYATGAQPPADMPKLSASEKAEIMFGTGVVFDEIGYLAGNERHELGSVAIAMRMIGERLQDEFEIAKTPDEFRRAQDGAHLMLHFANICLPHAAHGGVLKADVEPLRAAFERMRNIGTYPHIIDLSEVVLATLDMRQWNSELGKAMAPVIEPKKNYDIESVAGLYGTVWDSATRAVTRLTVDAANGDICHVRPGKRGDTPAV